MGQFGSKEAEEAEAREREIARRERQERRRLDKLERELDLELDLGLGTYGGGRSASSAPRRVTPPRNAVNVGAPGSSSLPVNSETWKTLEKDGGGDEQRSINIGNDVGEGDSTSKEIPMVFRWEGGGHDVYITGTFNKWKEKILMHRSGNDFTYVHGLAKGKHAYKFIVDDEWRFAPDQPTIADTHGNINNYIDLTKFENVFKVPREHENIATRTKVDVTRDDIFGREIPSLDDYSKEPPPLPPHLRHILLNSNSDNGGNAPTLPSPQHVTINHLYCSAIKDNLMVLGATSRYREKFVTTVHYSPTPFWEDVKMERVNTTLKGTEGNDGDDGSRDAASATQ